MFSVHFLNVQKRNENIRIYLAPLYKQIPPSSNEISSVEAGFVLCGHKLALSCQLVSVLHCADWILLKETRQQ